MNNISGWAFAFAVGTLVWSAPPASADDALKVAVGQRGFWDTAVCHLGSKAGIFKRHGLVLELLYTQGTGETQQAVISGSVDIGIGAGTMGVLGAFSKGAPVRILTAEATGAADYWYAATSSNIKTLKDADGKTIAYSTNGASTHSIVLAFIKEFNLKAKPVATGGPPATLTQLMSGQVDVGWAAPPFGFKEIDEGKIRIVAKAMDAPIVRGQTIRVNIVNADSLAKKKEAMRRFVDAYRETVAYMYSDDPRVIKDYAEFNGISDAVARRVRDDFFPRSVLEPDAVKGLDVLMPEAVTFKYISAPLTKEQLAEAIQIPPRTK
jgi:NitT/TauT family transport system substrate-binding protein